MIQGITSFTEYFKDFRNDYVIIGGLATAMIMHDLGFVARATKDVDLVIISKDNEAFIRQLLKYVNAAGYRTKQRTNNDTRHNLFRFLDSEDKSYPEQIELFTIHDEDSEILKDKHIMPIETPEYYNYLSAIILDTEYFDLLAKYTTELEGLHVATPEVLIPLKAHAYINLSEQNNQNTKKHLNDIIRLSTMLDETKQVILEGKPKDDFFSFLPILEAIDDNRVQNILSDAGINNISKETVVEILKSVYR